MDCENNRFPSSRVFSAQALCPHLPSFRLCLSSFCFFISQVFSHVLQDPPWLTLSLVFVIASEAVKHQTSAVLK